MPTLIISDPPCYQNHHTHHSHYKSLVVNHQYPLMVAYQRSSSSSYINIPSILNAKRKADLMVMRASDKPQSESSPTPDKNPSSSWKKWMVGIMLSIILPSFRHKWGPLLALKSKVDMAIETVESVTEVVEELAEQVGKVADEVADKLPDDTKLKEAIESVENLAKEAVEKAELAEEIIHKVEEVEKELEKTLTEADTEQSKVESPKTSRG